jgi:acyl-coenzyme A synthetase/AMP-(fatty) acid ligase
MPTFNRPNVSGPTALGLDALVDFHLHNNPDYPFAHLTPRDGHSTTVTWRELAEAVHRAGHILKDGVGPVDASPPPVVAIFAPDDALIYMTILMAIVRLGFIVSYLYSGRVTIELEAVLAFGHLDQKLNGCYITSAQRYVLLVPHCSRRPNQR